MTERAVLVTGASSGIGAAVCRRIAAPGVAILASARGGTDGGKRPALESLVAELREAGAEAEPFFADLAEEDPAKLVAAAVARFGRLDQLVANAGFANRAGFDEAAVEDLDRAYRTMTRAFFALAKAAKSELARSACGRVVAISSFVTRVVPAGQAFATTAAAKAGIEALARNLALELAPSGATVNCVAPGFTRKEAFGHSAMSSEAWERAARLTPLGRVAEPADIAAAVAFLLSEEARHITGQTLAVDGGLTLV